MKKIKKWFINFSLLEFLLFVILLAVLLFGILDYSQQTVKIDNLEKIVNSQKANIKAGNEIVLQLNDSTYNYLNSDIYQLQKDILTIKELNNSIANKVYDAHNDWLSYLANFWTLMGLALGSIAVVFSFKEKVKQEVEEKVKTEVAEKVKNEVAEKVSKLTGVEVEFIKQNLAEFQKHINLKQDAKIIVLNEEGTGLPDSFKKVMSLFPNHKIIDVVNLSEAIEQERIDEFKKSSLVIIENQVFSNLWKINTKRKLEIYNDLPQNLKHVYQSINTQIQEENKESEINKKIFKELATSICGETSILYYGGPGFPRFKDDRINENITFANAPSQLYGNILNMLKYKLETGEK